MQILNRANFASSLMMGMRTRERARLASRRAQGHALRRTPSQQPRLAATATPPPRTAPQNPWRVLASFLAPWRQKHSMPSPPPRDSPREPLETRRLRVRDAGRDRRQHPRSQILKRANFISPSRMGMARTRERARPASQRAQGHAPRRSHRSSRASPPLQRPQRALHPKILGESWRLSWRLGDKSTQCRRPRHATRHANPSRRAASEFATLAGIVDSTRDRKS